MEVEKDIKIKDLISFPFSVEENISLYDLEYLYQYFQLDSYDMDADKFSPELFEIRKIYDNPHASDEQSNRKLLFYKNEFTCLFGYTGDRGVETVLFASVEKKFVLRDYFLSLKTDYDNTSDILEETIDLSDNYTVFFQHESDFYYYITSPYWSYSFREGTPLYLIDNDETHFTPVTFVDFKIKDYWKKRYSGEEYKKENHFMNVKKGNEIIEVPFKKIVFKVEKSK